MCLQSVVKQDEPGTFACMCVCVRWVFVRSFKKDIVVCRDSTVKTQSHKPSIRAPFSHTAVCAHVFLPFVTHVSLWSRRRWNLWCPTWTERAENINGTFYDHSFHLHMYLCSARRYII